jgi:hypothetical protein
MVQGNAKPESRKDFTVQNCFLEKWKRMAFLSKHFNSPFVICDTIFLAEKTNLIYSFSIKIVLDIAFSNTMLKIV